MNQPGGRPSPSDSWRTVDAARGVLITVIAAAAGYFVLIPGPAGGPSISSTGLLLLALGLGLQLAVLFARPLLARLERAYGMEGRITPLALHVFQLFGDGLTVLLFALAVFGGISQFASNV